MLLKILILAVVQGVAELLPVSSSAHVIVVEKLLGLDPVSPEMTLLLVMLHTGTMFAFIAYFWHSWRVRYFYSRQVFLSFAKHILIATGFTGVVGLLLKSFLEKVVLGNAGDLKFTLGLANTQKQINGLSLLVIEHFRPDWDSNSFFIFSNRIHKKSKW